MKLLYKLSYILLLIQLYNFPNDCDFRLWEMSTIEPHVLYDLRFYGPLICHTFMTIATQSGLVHAVSKWPHLNFARWLLCKCSQCQIKHVIFLGAESWLGRDPAPCWRQSFSFFSCPFHTHFIGLCMTDWCTECYNHHASFLLGHRPGMFPPWGNPNEHHFPHISQCAHAYFNTKTLKYLT